MKIYGYEIKPGADLRNAYLEGADLRNASLKGANLFNADFRTANLEGADLSGANLRDADLMGAFLKRAKLQGAELFNADLRGADLQDADLSGADLEYANFRYVILFGTNLEGAKLPHFQIVPEEGSFIAYKKVNTGVIKLLIPEDAKRTSNLVGRKCRASHVKVLEGSGKSMTHIEHQLEYKEGEIVYADKYDDDIRIECTSGIHFFMTRREAEEY